MEARANPGYASSDGSLHHRALPEVPVGERPYSFWSGFGGRSPESDPSFNSHSSRGGDEKRSSSDSFPSDIEDVTSLRMAAAAAGGQAANERAQSEHTESGRRRRTLRELERTVNNKLDVTRFPSTTSYVSRWVSHSHPRGETRDDCAVCSEQRLHTLIHGDQCTDLKYNNPKIRRHLLALQNRIQSAELVHQISVDKPGSAKDLAHPPNQHQTIELNETYFQEEVAPNVPVSYRNLSPDVYFSDQARKVDFVLAYEVMKSESKEDKNTKKVLLRDQYFDNLHAKGIHMEEEVVEKQDKWVHYLKVHVPFDVLALYAEDLNLRAPVEVSSAEELQWSLAVQQRWLPFLPNPMYSHLPYQYQAFFSAPFRIDCFYKFIGHEDPETFFQIRHRIRIAHEILVTTAYGDRKKCEVGYDRMVQDGVISAAFPLHDGPYELDEERAHDCKLWNSRQVLKFFWANPRQWFKYQPLDLIRDYYGEKTGIYFAWLGFYTGWLLLATLVGLLVVIASFATMFDNPVADQICGSGDQFLMCPQCDFGCETWALSDTCYYVRVAYLFDNGYTIFFGAFISFWSVFFLEFWKRTNATLAYRWDVHDFQPQEERPRSQYILKSREERENPITGQTEAYFSEKSQGLRIVAGITTLLFMMMVVIIFVIGVVIYRSLIMQPLHKLATEEYDWASNYTPLIAVATGALLQVILIQISGLIYTFVAETLTEWETHRTENEHENHLAFKIFVFQFLNQYSSVLYVAFFKGRFSGYPGQYTSAFGSDARLEQCTNNDCLMEMAQNLVIIFVGKQIANNAIEIGKPVLMKFLNTWLAGKGAGEDADLPKSQIEKEHILPPCPDLFEEYLEMVLQFGFVTIFSCSFPLAPFFALLNNFIEVRVDANKYVCQVRRGIPERANSIGIWYELLAAISRVAVICNAFLISFTSDFLNKVMYRRIFGHDNMEGYIEHSYPFAPDQYYTDANVTQCRYKGLRDETGSLTIYYWKLFGFKLVFLLLFEHLVIVIGIMIDMFVPDVPGALDLKIKREQFIAKQTFSKAAAAGISNDQVNDLNDPEGELL